LVSPSLFSCFARWASVGASACTSALQSCIGCTSTVHTALSAAGVAGCTPSRCTHARARCTHARQSKCTATSCPPCLATKWL
jgi:hypothetical protein